MRAARKRRSNRNRFVAGGLIVALVVGLIALLINHSTGGTKSASSTSTTVAQVPTAAAVTGGQSVTGATPCPKTDGSSPRTSHFAQAPPLCIDPTKHYTATFDTSQGTIVVALDTTTTPNTTNNFVVLSLYHYYDGSSFDRIDQSLNIIQGGSPSTQTIADPGPGYTIKDEPAAKFTTDSSGNLHGPFTYAPGDLVMARGGAANSASAQYFFVTGPNAASGLNSQGTYVVFGQVTTGLSILQNIEKNMFEACPSTDPSCLGGVPSQVVLVRSIKITEQ